MAGGTFLWQLQQAIYSALTGDATLVALVTGIYDYVPTNANAPYVVIGEELSEERFDTMGKYGRQASLVIHTWSRYRGMKEVLTILDRVLVVLDGVALTFTGWTHTHTWHESTDTAREADGLTRHGWVTLRVEARQGT